MPGRAPSGLARSSEAPTRSSICGEARPGDGPDRRADPGRSSLGARLRRKLVGELRARRHPRRAGQPRDLEPPASARLLLSGLSLASRGLRPLSAAGEPLLRRRSGRRRRHAARLPRHQPGAERGLLAAGARALPRARREPRRGRRRRLSICRARRAHRGRRQSGGTQRADGGGLLAGGTAGTRAKRPSRIRGPALVRSGPALQGERDRAAAVDRALRLALETRASPLHATPRRPGGRPARGGSGLSRPAQPGSLGGSAARAVADGQSPDRAGSAAAGAQRPGDRSALPGSAALPRGAPVRLLARADPAGRLVSEAPGPAGAARLRSRGRRGDLAGAPLPPRRLRTRPGRRKLRGRRQPRAPDRHDPGRAPALLPLGRLLPPDRAGPRTSAALAPARTARCAGLARSAARRTRGCPHRRMADGAAALPGRPAAQPEQRPRAEQRRLRRAAAREPCRGPAALRSRARDRPLVPRGLSERGHLSADGRRPRSGDPGISRRALAQSGRPAAGALPGRGAATPGTHARGGRSVGPASRGPGRAVSSRRIAQALLVLSLLGQIFWLGREVWNPPPDFNDDLSHAALARACARAWASGADPTDPWLVPTTTGFPLAHHYQHLLHVAVGGLSALTGIGVEPILRWIVALALLLLPVSVAWLLRRVGASVAVACSAGALAPLVAGPGPLAPLVAAPSLYGIDLGSYLWAGHGLSTQAVGVSLLPLVLAGVVRGLRGDSHPARAGALVALLILTHTVFGWLAALTALALAVLLRDPPRRLLGIGVFSACGTAFVLIPF